MHNSISAAQKNPLKIMKSTILLDKNAKRTHNRQTVTVSENVMIHC